VLDRDARDRPAGPQHVNAPELGQAVAEQRERIRVTGALARLAQHHADHPRAGSPGGRAHEHVVGLPGKAGLDSVDDRDTPDQAVAVHHRARALTALETRGGQVDDAGEPRLAH
jgi:hypothetical protein